MTVRYIYSDCSKDFTPSCLTTGVIVDDIGAEEFPIDPKVTI